MITKEMLADAMSEIDPAIIDEHVKRVSHSKVAARYVVSAVIYAAACIAVVLTLPFLMGKGNESPVTPANSAEVTTDSAEQTKPIETTSETEAPEPDPEKNYKWVIEPGIYSGDIQPIYGWYGKAVNIGLVVLDDKYLVDYNGNIKYTLPDKADQKDTGYSFCDVCNIILCSDGVITPDTYEIANNMGHGGNFVINYIYDSETGFICYDDYGGYTEETENIPYAIVAEGIRRPSTPEDGVYNDYAYDLTGRYGIVVNSKLVVPFEYDSAVKYDSFGIAKLRKDGKWAFFNSEGEMILGNDYLSYYETTDGYIPLNRDGKWGYADLEGNIVIDHVFEEARSVYCGKAWVKTDAGWGVIEVYEPNIMTEEEAKQIVREMFEGRENLVSLEITPNDMSYYECIGYGFDVKTTYSTGHERSSSLFLNYDGVDYCPQYYFDEDIQQPTD